MEDLEWTDLLRLGLKGCFGLNLMSRRRTSESQEKIEEKIFHY
jgi:hypothetical protein